MSAIINALFGTYPDPPPANTSQAVAGQSASSFERIQTSAVGDDVQVRSMISSETLANAAMNSSLNINGLLAQLSTTHAQVDQYSRTRTAEINEQVQKSIGDVLANTQRQQEELLVDANRRHLIIDQEYRLQLQKAIEALDAVKAKTLSELERDLQGKQHIIMEEAKKEIDLLNEQANASKLHALVQAQEQAKQDISHLADQVAAIGQQDTQNVLQSTTTTIITSEAQAVGHAETVVTPTDAQLQVAVQSPKELVAVSVAPVAAETAAIVQTAPVETAVVAPVTGVSDSTTTVTTTASVEPVIATVPVDAISNSTAVVTEVKPN